MDEHDNIPELNEEGYEESEYDELHQFMDQYLYGKIPLNDLHKLLRLMLSDDDIHLYCIAKKAFFIADSRHDPGKLN